MSSVQPILPGATLGVLGGGQLGRMFTIAATRMGYRVAVFAPESGCPAGQVAHEHVCAAFDDERALCRFAEKCDAVTIEFENVPVTTLEVIGEIAPTRPGPEVLAIAQDRLRERAFLVRHHFPCANHAAVHCRDDLDRALDRVGTPAVIKSARFGYDGRGQARVDQHVDAQKAWAKLDVDAALYEEWVEFDREVSVLVARSPSGEIEVFGPIENVHANHILDVSVVPANVPTRAGHNARELAREIAEALQLHGIICVEMFLTHDGSLLVNELAPRPHNSGHLTIEACAVSQFEQQVRAMCGLPLGEMSLRSPAAMVNLFGDLWSHTEPSWERALAVEGTSLHLYGKSSPRPGRKMGHITAIADTAHAARERALAARTSLHVMKRRDSTPFSSIPRHPMCLTIASPNSLHLSSVAPSMSRSKS